MAKPPTYHLRVPIHIVENNGISSDKVNSQSSCSSREQEELWSVRRIACLIEPIHLIPPGHLTSATIDPTDIPALKFDCPVFDYIKHRRELTEALVRDPARVCTIADYLKRRALCPRRKSSSKRRSSSNIFPLAFTSCSSRAGWFDSSNGQSKRYGWEHIFRNCMTRLRRRMLLTFLTRFSNRSALHPYQGGTQLLTRLLHLVFPTKDLNGLGRGSLSLRGSFEVFVVALLDVVGGSASPPLY